MNTREGRPVPEDETTAGEEIRVSAESMGDWRRTHLCGALRGAEPVRPRSSWDGCSARAITAA
jgi:hypothetical protein